MCAVFHGFHAWDPPPALARDGTASEFDHLILGHGLSFLQTIQAANLVYKPAILVESRMRPVSIVWMSCRINHLNVPFENIPQLDDSRVSILDRKAAPFGDLIVYVFVAH